MEVSAFPSTLSLYLKILSNFAKTNSGSLAQDAKTLDC